MSFPIKVVLDTDIGGDIDDSWALGLLIKSPELEPVLVLSDTCNTVYRTKCCARFLQEAGRPDIPLGIGLVGNSDSWRESLAGYVGDYNLEDYPGFLDCNGMNFLLEILEKNDDVTIIGIGPLTNLGALSRNRPDLVAKCRLVVMAGSIERNHRNAPGAIAEFNVQQDIRGAQAVFAAPWKEIVMTPLDSCGDITLEEEDFQAVLKSESPAAKAIIRSYACWKTHFKHDDWDGVTPTKSTVLFDTVAVALAFTERFFRMEDMKLVVDDEGFTKRDSTGRPVRVAMEMTDVSGFKKFLINRLCSFSGNRP